MLTSLNTNYDACPRKPSSWLQTMVACFIIPRVTFVSVACSPKVDQHHVILCGVPCCSYTRPGIRYLRCCI